MKKLMYGGLFLAVVGIGFIGCKKQMVEIKNKSTSKQNLVVKKSSFINPYDHVGQNLYLIL